MLNKRLKNLAIVGCSYSHWTDGKCFGKSYPALIAKNNQEYNVFDLSICGDSNSTVWYKIKNTEEKYKIKFDKIIWQITHLERHVYFSNNYQQYKPLEIMQKRNYFFTNGEYVEQYEQTDLVALQSWMTYEDKRDWILDYMKKIQKIHNLDIRNIVVTLENYYNHWNVQQIIDLINARYGVENVLIFSWHRATKNAGLKFEHNYKGCVEDWVGDNFRKLGVDSAPHYGEAGHTRVFKHLHPDVKRLLAR
jgi:hypothetical protein